MVSPDADGAQKIISKALDMRKTMSHNPIGHCDQHAVRQFFQIRSELIHEPASKAIHAAIFLPQKHLKKQIRDERSAG